MTERMTRLRREIDKLRRHSDEVLLAATKMASIYRAEGLEREAEQCEKAAEFIQRQDNDRFMASITLPIGQ